MLSNKLNDCVTLSYEEWCAHMNEAAKEVAYEINNYNIGWFKLSSYVMIPLINIKNVALTKARASEGEDVHLINMCKTARKNVRDVVEVSTGKFVEHLVSKIKKMNLRPKEAWDNIKIFRKGCTGHHEDKNVEIL